MPKAIDPKRLARYEAEVKRDAEQSSFSKWPFHKLDMGSNYLRILPGQDPGSVDKDFYVKVVQHFAANPNNPKLPVTCPKSIDLQARCPICEYVQKARRGTEAEKQEADPQRPQTKYLMGVIPQEGENRGKICILRAPQRVKNQILAYFRNRQYGDLTDPNEGFNVTIERTGKGRDTNYTVIPDRDPTAIATRTSQIKAILDNQPDLWKFRIAPSADQIEKWMEGRIERFEYGDNATKPKPVANAAEFNPEEYPDDEEEVVAEGTEEETPVEEEVVEEEVEVAEVEGEEEEPAAEEEEVYAEEEDEEPEPVKPKARPRPVEVADVQPRVKTVAATVRTVSKAATVPSSTDRKELYSSAQDKINNAIATARARRVK